MTSTRREILEMALAAPLLIANKGARRESAPDQPVAVTELRKLFPQLATTVHNQPLVYLDSAGTTLRPSAVLETILNFYQKANANPGRGIHSLATHAMDAFEHARAQVANFINAEDPLEIIWTRGTTEAINLFAYSWAVPRLRSGDEIIMSIAEHSSCMLPLQITARKTGATVRYIDVDDDGRLRLDLLDSAFSRRTKLVCFTHVSNVLGVVNPAKEICHRAEQNGARVLIDAAQSVPHLPIDVRDLNCDFAAFSSHKMLGPMGAGVLYARRDAMEEMEVYQAGANMAHARSLTQWEYEPSALRFGAGTPSVADALGFAAAAQMLAGLGRDALWKQEQELTSYALEQLASVPRLRIVGPKSHEDRVSIFSFVIDGIGIAELVRKLDTEGICIRAGDLASLPLFHRFKLQAVARASLYVYTIRSEVDKLASALRRATDA